MTETLFVLLHNYVDHYLQLLFGPSQSWTDTVSALANAAMAVIALGAAWWGFRQYSLSRRFIEFEATLRLRQEANLLLDQFLELVRRRDATHDQADGEESERLDSALEQQLDDALDRLLSLSEVYAASYIKKTVPGVGREFVGDFLRYEVAQMQSIDPIKKKLAFDPVRPNRYAYLRKFLAQEK